MCRVPGRVCGALSTFTTPQDGDPRLHCRDKADNSQVGARGSPAHCDAGFADTGFVDTGFVDTGLVDTGFVDTGFVDTGFVDTGFVDTGHHPDRLPTGDITEQATSHPTGQPQHRRPACQTTAPSYPPLSMGPR